MAECKELKKATEELVKAIDKNIEIIEDKKGNDVYIVNMQYITKEASKVADLIDYKG